MNSKELAEEQAEVCASHSDYTNPKAKIMCGKLHGFAGVIHALLYIGNQLSMIANTYRRDADVA